MKVSDYIIYFLYEKGITEIFGFAGGAVIHLIDSIYKHGGIKYITTYHEQTASIAAEGYSWSNPGKAGVAIVTSGPGATNLITGIADAFFDSISAIYITGQVNTYEYKYNKAIRQQGFQETDIVSIVTPVTKYAVMVDDVRRIRYELEKAWSIALSDRKGPVLLDIPMDIQRADIDIEILDSYSPEVATREETFDIELIHEKIKKSERPLFLIGAGCKDCGLVEEYVEQHRIPIVYSLLGKGLIPDKFDFNVGMIGSYGIRSANIVFENADLVVILGSRLDTRQTGTNINSLVENGKTLIRIDIDPNELKEHRLAEKTILINMSVESFLKSMNKLNIKWNVTAKWLSYIEKIKSKYGMKAEIQKNITNKLPYEFMEKLNAYVKEPVLYCADIGHNQMFSAQGLSIQSGQDFKTSGGMAPMGFSIPFSIGYSITKSRKVISINGDGGFHIALQSLMLLRQHHLPVKVVILNNRSLGMITQFQNKYFDNLRYGTIEMHGYSVPDFKHLSSGYGLKYLYYDFSDDEKLKSYLSDDEPCIIEVNVGSETVVYPKLEVNMPLGNQDPKLSPSEYESTRFM